VKGEGEAGGALQASGRHRMSEPEGRGAAWTEERATSEGGAVKGEGEAGGAPQASGTHGMSQRQRDEEGGSPG
jgi:hypothetical protein